MKQGIAILICCIVHLILGGYFLLIAVRGGPPQVIGFAATAAFLYLQLMIGDAVLLPGRGFNMCIVALGTLSIFIGIIFWGWLFFSGNGWSKEFAGFTGLILWTISAISQVFLYFYFIYNRPPKRSTKLQKSKSHNVLDFSSMSYASHGTPSLTCMSTSSTDNDKMIYPPMTAISPVYERQISDKSNIRKNSQFCKDLKTQKNHGFSSSRKLRSIRRRKNFGYRHFPLYTTWHAPFHQSKYPYFSKKTPSFLNMKIPLMNLYFSKNRETIVEGPDWNTWDFSNFDMSMYSNSFSNEAISLNDNIYNNESLSALDTLHENFDTQMTQSSCFRRFFEDLNNIFLKKSILFIVFMRKKRKLETNDTNINVNLGKEDDETLIVCKFEYFVSSLQDLVEYALVLKKGHFIEEKTGKIYEIVLQLADMVKKDPFFLEMMSLSQNSLKIELVKDSEIPSLPEIKDPLLLKQVFTHRSYAYSTQSYNVSERDILKLHNERLEFLGDSYLNHAVTRLLFKAFPDAREGELSMMRSELVGNTKAEKISRLYGFDKRLLLSESAESDNVRSLKKIVADIFESYIGGLVLDSSNGEKIAFRWISQLMAPDISLFQKKQKNSVELDKMAKQTLYNRIGREYHTDGQARKKIEYIWIGGEGGNKDGYEYSCRIDGQEVGRGWGPNQKIAGIRSAMDALVTFFLFKQDFNIQYSGAMT
ncbi:hypothetical protein MERGE_001377 [Pneumocystis wakefieldiae]|uniref:ribonuclease III n=1 Tax=Pneumocystis wakefieldiae TaxID=38082 RepID=A0A899FSY3_9ASCO|nr:hypothetical protein MERGE_001377 [Pneumocystis wakefieldiae]